MSDVAASTFTALEQAVLKEICAREPSVGVGLEVQLAAATVTDRKNTGVGFYTDFSVPSTIARLETTKMAIGEIWAKIEGFESPMTFLVFVKDGYATCLEGATVGDSTIDLDLRALQFEILPI